MLMSFEVAAEDDAGCACDNVCDGDDEQSMMPTMMIPIVPPNAGAEC